MKRPQTPEQLRQRKLAWLLRITEGYIANAHSFARFNFNDLPHGSIQRLNRTLDQACLAAERMRADLRRL